MPAWKNDRDVNRYWTMEKTSELSLTSTGAKKLQSELKIGRQNTLPSKEVYDRVAYCRRSCSIVIQTAFSRML